MWREIHIFRKIGFPPDAKKKFEYACGAGFRDKNHTNLDQNILEVNEDFETNECRKVMGIIAIHEEEILMSGKEMFVEYITQRISQEFEADRYADNETMFMWMGISKKNNPRNKSGRE